MDVVNVVKGGTNKTKEDLLNKLKGIKVTKFSCPDGLKLDSDYPLNEVTYQNADVIARADNVLAKLGIDAEVVFAFESGKNAGNLTYGDGLEFKQVVFASNGIVYEFGIGALSKDEVLRNTNKWNAQIDGQKNIDHGNVTLLTAKDEGDKSATAGEDSSEIYEIELPEFMTYDSKSGYGK